jgi:hypothetical protein
MGDCGVYLWWRFSWGVVLRKILAKKYLTIGSGYFPVFWHALDGFRFRVGVDRCRACPRCGFYRESSFKVGICEEILNN